VCQGDWPTRCNSTVTTQRSDSQTTRHSACAAQLIRLTSVQMAAFPSAWSSYWVVAFGPTFANSSRRDAPTAFGECGNKTG